MSGLGKRAPRHPPEVHAGFIPLVDCAALVMAKELGFDIQGGFRLILYRETSWANIRDKVDVGVFDCAHMLAPMPIASALGLGRATEALIAPMALSLNGNVITVSRSLHAEMRAVDEAATLRGGMAAAHPLAAIARRRHVEGREPLSLGIVFPFSSHNYDLRYWLAAAGIDPDNDVNLLVIPPPLIAESLEAGRIDGFCVGAPWGSVAVEAGAGVIVATKNELWAMSPEKVLGVRQRWAEENPELLAALIRAVTLAARWLDKPENRAEAARVLARPEYVGVAEDILIRPLTGTLDRGDGQPPMIDPDMVVFHRNAANFPWRSHALWLMTQMIRWGQVRTSFDLDRLAAQVYRPDLYRRSVAGLGIEVPIMDRKWEGGRAPLAATALDRTAPESMSHPQDRHPPIGGTFFGDETFDPDAALAYLNRLRIRSPAAPLDAFGVAADGDM